MGCLECCEVFFDNLVGWVELDGFLIGRDCRERCR
jgi:hypothetical protein